VRSRPKLNTGERDRVVWASIVIVDSLQASVLEPRLFTKENGAYYVHYIHSDKPCTKSKNAFAVLYE